MSLLFQQVFGEYLFFLNAFTHSKLLLKNEDRHLIPRIQNKLNIFPKRAFQNVMQSTHPTDFYYILYMILRRIGDFFCYINIFVVLIAAQSVGARSSNIMKNKGCEKNPEIC